MKILLQSNQTRDYVDRGGGWTWKQGRALLFANGLEAIMFCFAHHIGNMQIVCIFRDLAKNFNIAVTDCRQKV